MVLWVPLALGSAIANATYLYGLKRLIGPRGWNLVAGAIHLSASAVLFLAAFAIGIPRLGPPSSRPSGRPPF
jgi:drug/metabolite transporter (DMT)-like permease